MPEGCLLDDGTYVESEVHQAIVDLCKSADWFTKLPLSQQRVICQKLCGELQGLWEKEKRSQLVEQFPLRERTGELISALEAFHAELSKAVEVDN